MARRKRRYTKHTQEEHKRHLTFEMNPETKRGITVVVFFALAALMFLSFFHIAGSLGDWINLGLAQFFGLDRYFVPIVLIMIGATFAYPERGTFSAWNYLGLFFFFLSFNATLNLILVNRPEPFTQDLAAAGGYIGQFLGLMLPHFVGTLGALVINVALLIVSIMLIFNTSLRSLVGVHTHVTGWLGEWMHRGGGKDTEKRDEEELEEEEEVEVEVEEEEDEEEEEVEEDAHAFRTTPVVAKAAPETVLSTKSRRQIIPPLTLLDRSNSKAQSGDIERNKQVIEKTFGEFGIDVEMGDTAVGPTVTQYTLRPSQGVKLSRIVGLQNDLALALAAHPIRMEAPIPGKSLVGIEVPNTKVATVALRDLLESKPYRARTSVLSIPLGKDVSGHTWVIALEKMPHLLVAGATGSGKSVCLNTIILSLVYQNGPDDLKLVLVDPKRVELTAYAGIPHLLVPPIVNVDDTVNALKWTVREMERRLDLLSKFGARNIDDYNARVEERMPKIVIVIDELADLMSSSGREVEGAIVRIAQMARAVGIHLVLATQRPSVDVITGLIKANIPGRVAFAVASQTDSRTILDQSGAEKLLGRGDMLFTSAELAKPKRLQGAFVSSGELERVVSYLKQKGEPDYNMAITEITKAGTVFDDPDGSDPLLEECIQVAIQAGKASTSLLQRRLRIGYGRAARIMDLLEQAGVIGAADGSKPREVLVTEWPIGGDLKEGMPTAQDEYEEAESYSLAKRNSDEALSLEEEDTHWEDKVDDRWIGK
ncbi:DNA translocase FtsK [Candidatus Parcubacteria bacterium]|nr:DNA translocase FtsK [Candidatus Parcubacteria bacterium]